MGYSNAICKREPGEHPYLELSANGSIDIEKYYVSLFERDFLKRVIFFFSYISGPRGVP